MCLWDSMLFRVWYSKWVISVGINTELLFSCKNASVNSVIFGYLSFEVRASLVLILCSVSKLMKSSTSSLEKGN